MKNPNRKLPRLAEFDYSQSGSYFITLCTQNRADLFQVEPIHSSIQNQIIHKWIRETEHKFSNISIDKYVIMPDHLHLIITIIRPEPMHSLPDIMHFFKTMTTNEYIQKVHAGILPAFEKKLWQKSYYDHVIRGQQDYDEIWQYIENNPLKWTLIHNINP